MPEMISASFGSATRHMSLKMTITATTTTPMAIRIAMSHPLSVHILVTTTVRGGKYSTTTIVDPVRMVSSESVA